MIEVIGLIGAICFALHTYPEIYVTWRRKETRLGLGMLLLWTLGEIFTITYIHLTTNDPILLLNYYLNLLGLIILWKYRRSPT